MWIDIDEIREIISGKCEPEIITIAPNKLRMNKRSVAIRLAMRELRKRRHTSGLNAHGRIYGSPKPKKNKLKL